MSPETVVAGHCDLLGMDAGKSGPLKSSKCSELLNHLSASELGFCAEVFWVLHLVSKHGHNGAYGWPQQFDGRLGKKAIPGEQLRITETAPPRCRMD